MVFSSVAFIFYFLPVFLVGYYLSGWRAGALLTGSVAFYVWGEGVYIALLAALIAVNYVGSRCLIAVERGARRTAILGLLVGTDFAVLGYFKYWAFLAHTLNAGLGAPILAETHRALPLGISFFTFQLASYAVDVHRGQVQVERDPIRFAAYILMFPHLIAGPIVRYADIREEMHGDRRRSGHPGLGLQYFIVGLCQKVLIANTVAPLADNAFSKLAQGLDGTTAWLGVWAYTLQIYFDFCGYSNMAIGLALLLGFTFPKNFDYPYAAQSMTEFWRRWHMSLSSWFRDYVYIPLGGNRLGRWKTVRNLVVVFFLTGLWHGAAWRFIAWGLYHGALLLAERFGLGRVLQVVPKLFRHVYLLVAVMLGWVLFRADDLPAGLGIIRTLFDVSGFRAPDVTLRLLANSQVLMALGLGSVLAFPLAPVIWESLRIPRAEPRRPERPDRLDTRSVHAIPVPLLLAGFLLSVALLVGSTLNPFLYFRF